MLPKKTIKILEATDATKTTDYEICFVIHMKMAKKLTCVLPALPNVESWKNGLSGDSRISSTSLVMSRSLNTSFRHSD